MLVTRASRFLPIFLCSLAFCSLAPLTANAVQPATALVATAESSSSIRLRWLDSADETGYRVERSPDGTAWLPIATPAGNSTTYLDLGRPAASFFYYRVIATSGPTSSPASNVAAASTWPATALKVCPTQASQQHTMARLPSAAWNGSGWGVVYADRKGGVEDELYFQALAPDTTPLGPAVKVTSTDPISTSPTLRWNGSRYGLLWNEQLRAEGDEPIQNVATFALLDAQGQKLSETRLLSHTFINNNSQETLVWNGSGWGVLLVTYAPQYLVYMGLDADGRLVQGPDLVTDEDTPVGSSSAVWNGSEYGVTYAETTPQGFGVYFQRLSLTGAPVGTLQTLFSNTTGGIPFGGTSTLWNGTGWIVAFSDWNQSTNSIVVYLARLNAAGALLEAPHRVSDDFDDSVPPAQTVQDRWPFLVSVPGGYAVFVSSFRRGPRVYEATRLLADLDGVRQGSRTVLSENDGIGSDGPRPAVSPASGILLVWDENAGSLEVGRRLLDSSGNATLLPAGTLTSGHGTGGVAGTNPALATLQSGFVSVFGEVPDQATGGAILQAWIVDGSGAITTKSPLSTRPSTGPFGVASAGDTFAVAWSSGNEIYFCRYDAAGNAILPETLVATPGSSVTVRVVFSGEAYGVVWGQGRPRLQRVAPDGTLIGGPILLPTVPGGFGPPEAVWTGSGWGIVWRGGSTLYFGLVDGEGNVVVPSAVITSSSVSSQYRAAFDGTNVGVAIQAGTGLSLLDVYFASVRTDGVVEVPPALVVAGPFADGQQLALTHEGDRYRLVFYEGYLSGLSEISILPNGTVLSGPRPASNVSGLVATAWNGLTTGYLFVGGPELYFQTSACLDDPTRPPCPSVTSSMAAAGVLLSWGGLSDPESGLLGYTVYRDGTQLTTKLPTAFSHLDESAFGTHTYEVRALSGAFQESTGCATLVVCSLDATPPVVTPPSPASVAVGQTTCAGGAGATLAGLASRYPAEHAALTALLGGGSAVDDCAAPVTRLSAQKAGQDVVDSTHFPLGPSTVQLRFRDGIGNVGSAPVTVTVRRQGDVDTDGAIGVFDLVIVANLIVGNVTAGTAPFLAPQSAADADGDGDVDLFDLVLLAGFVVGNVPCLTP